MSDIIIKIENISKQYRLGQVGTGTISHDLNRWWYKVRGKEDPYLKIGDTNDRTAKSKSGYVWALKDISFDVKQGEVLGIIGKNGAGKSTLLKLLSRVTAPTTGSIRAKGRIASLLEVGTGFHPELTGRENVFMNGSILGMTKAEIKQKFDEIVAFAGVEKYIDTPVKRYSSGMTVRLGFAVAAHLEPEIMVVDEVLAVGDAEFQKKAIGKMQNVSHSEGRTILFVSHNMDAIKKMCTRCVLLSNGYVEGNGDTDTICDMYLNDFYDGVLESYSYDLFPDEYVGDKYVQLLEMKLVDEQMQPIKSISVTTKFGVMIRYQILDDLYKPDLSFLVSTLTGEKVFQSVYETKDYSKGEKAYVAWLPSNLLNNIDYSFMVGITTTNPVFIHLQKSIKFSVQDDLCSLTRENNYRGIFHGNVRPYINWINLNK